MNATNWDAVAGTVTGRLARTIETTDSAEWVKVCAIALRWSLTYDRESVRRTADKLAQRYHVSGNIYGKPVPRGLTYDQARERYAAWKSVASVVGNPHVAWK